MHNYRLTPSAQKHIIFYLRSDNHIDIIGILHGKMDIDKNFM